MTKLGDPQRFLVRNMVVSGVGLFGCLFIDVAHRIFYRLGWEQVNHPVHFGIFQIVGTIFFLWNLINPLLEDWKYYF